MDIRTTEHPRRTLWTLIVSPTIWAVHFLLCYITAAIWCGKLAERSAPLTPVEAAIVGYTVVALAIIGVTGWFGYRDHTRGGGQRPHDDDTPMDRTRFLGFSTLLLSGLSALAVVYAALTVVFLETCQ